MPDLDTRVRLAAFAFLEEQVRLAGEEGSLRRDLLQAGFSFEGQRVPLVSRQGIFKPRLLAEIPLSITTVAVLEGEDAPYDDAFGEDGLLRYRYRGIDPRHRENVGLRLAMTRQTPLIYFHGIVPGLYQAAWPVYIVGDDPARLTFTVSVDEARFVGLDSAAAPESPEADIRRRYATRQFQQRLHQREFRERVLQAYRRYCAVCRLHRDPLLEAAHIGPDSDPRGAPVVPNGLALCTLHHAAFDAHLLGVTPDYVVQLRDEVMDEEDGPMLIHGLQGFHGAHLLLPRREAWRPDRSRLEERFARFRCAAG